MKKMLDKDFVKLLAQMGNPIVPSSDKRVKRVQNVVDQLISSTNLPGMQWELTLIESKETNAFVTPSGHICVFTGILPLLKDDDMLAAVIGHEIGHVIAGHARESMSKKSIAMLLIPMLALLGVSMDATVPTWDLVMNRPGSRLHESEADYIGLMLMAEACFDPAAAPKVWVTMGKATGKEPPQFLSTHPSHGARRERLLEWLPKARDKAAASDCGKISNLTVPFYQAAKDSSEEIW
ncbi:MAG: hypothetical protein M1814_000008 [Vezdaea aestivalis]|nr:MAG: hypothetical protein M1814_000008 [Vezdaea aestivalis]